MPLGAPCAVGHMADLSGAQVPIHVALDGPAQGGEGQVEVGDQQRLNATTKQGGANRCWAKGRLKITKIRIYTVDIKTNEVP